MKNIVSICTQKKGCTLKDHVKGKLKKKLQKQSSLTPLHRFDKMDQLMSLDLIKKQNFKKIKKI